MNGVIPIPESPYFVVNCQDETAELYSTSDKPNPISLNGEADGVISILESPSFVVDNYDGAGELNSASIPSGVYSMVIFSDENTELWGNAEPFRGLGLGVVEFTRAPDGRLIVGYIPGRAYLLDLPWLSAMQGEANTIALEDLIDILCECLLSWGLADDAELARHLQG